MKTTATAILAAIALALGLAGCAGQKTDDTIASLKTTLDRGEFGLSIAEVALAGYRTFPVCDTAGAQTVCYNPQIGTIADAAIATLYDAIAAARAGLASFGTGGTVDVPKLVASIVSALTEVNKAIAGFKPAT